MEENNESTEASQMLENYNTIKTAHDAVILKPTAENVMAWNKIMASDQLTVLLNDMGKLLKEKYGD